MTGSVPRLSVVVPTFNNVAILRRCLDSWERFGGADPYEIIVTEDGCRDETAAFLTARTTTPWGERHLRWIPESNVHELRATNRGLREARAPIVLTWHDDMFLLVDWFIPELLESFERYHDIGLFCLSRGLLFSPCDEPLLRWEDAIDWRRQQSTIGPSPWNWLRACEVDGVIRPWAVRRACLDRVGLLDEAFVPTGWDESDLAFRIRAAGWRVATHGYERVAAFKHLGSSTFAKFALNLDRDLENARRFYTRWTSAIRDGANRPRVSWRRPMSAAAWWHTARVAANFSIPERRAAILRGEPAVRS